MNSVSNDLALAPLGAGDLIDRAVRLYRRHFLTLIRIAAPPVLVSAVGSTVTTIAFRALTTTSSGLRVGLYVLALIGGWVIIICGALFSLIVMGGATRNLVSHLIWNEPVSVRTTYHAVKTRFLSLLGASVMVGLWLMFAASVATMAGWFLAIIVFVAAGIASSVSTWITVLVGGV